MRAHAAPDGTVAILFSDIEDSTVLTEKLGDERWLEVLREHNAIFREQISRHDGYEVKSQGDGFMLAFPDPCEALECAIDVQRAFAERERDGSGESLRVRIGLHTGEVISEEGDYFGKNVILAARIAAQAAGRRDPRLRGAARRRLERQRQRPALRRRPRARAQGAGGQPPRLPRRVGRIRDGSLTEEFVTHTIELPSGELRLLQPAEAAEIPDDHQVEWAPLAPYWSVLWRSGVALARELDGRSWTVGAWSSSAAAWRCRASRRRAGGRR